MTPAAFAMCLMLSAQTHDVPVAALIGIMSVEGGHVGQEVADTNGTADLGPMQVNTVWVPRLARIWNMDTKTVHDVVRDDACTNAEAAAWILRRSLDQAGGRLGMAISYYHSMTPTIGIPYAQKVIATMKRFGLVKPAEASQTPISSTKVD